MARRILTPERKRQLELERAALPLIVEETIEYIEPESKPPPLREQSAVLRFGGETRDLVFTRTAEIIAEADARHREYRRRWATILAIVYGAAILILAIIVVFQFVIGM